MVSGLHNNLLLYTNIPKYHLLLIQFVSNAGRSSLFHGSVCFLFIEDIFRDPIFPLLFLKDGYSVENIIFSKVFE